MMRIGLHIDRMCWEYVYSEFSSRLKLWRDNRVVSFQNDDAPKSSMAERAMATLTDGGFQSSVIEGDIGIHVAEKANEAIAYLDTHFLGHPYSAIIGIDDSVVFTILDSTHYPSNKYSSTEYGTMMLSVEELHDTIIEVASANEQYAEHLKGIVEVSEMEKSELIERITNGSMFDEMDLQDMNEEELLDLYESLDIQEKVKTPSFDIYNADEEEEGFGGMGFGGMGFGDSASPSTASTPSVNPVPPATTSPPPQPATTPPTPANPPTNQYGNKKIVPAKKATLLPVEFFEESSRSGQRFRPRIEGFGYHWGYAYQV